MLFKAFLSRQAVEEIPVNHLCYSKICLKCDMGIIWIADGWMVYVKAAGDLTKRQSAMEHGQKKTQNFASVSPVKCDE